MKNGVFRAQTVLLIRKLTILTAPTSFPPSQEKGPGNEVAEKGLLVRNNILF